MNVSAAKLSWKPFWTTVASASLVSVLVQTAGLLVWGARIELRVEALEASHKDIDSQLARIDERGSRQLPLIEQRLLNMESRLASWSAAIERLNAAVPIYDQRLKLVEDTVQQRTAIMQQLLTQKDQLTPLQQNLADQAKRDTERIEQMLRSEISRIDQRLDRLVVALDATYNLINEHLRNPNEPRNPKLNLLTPPLINNTPKEQPQ